MSGYKVHVICADYKANNNINWCHDVSDNSNIIIHRIKMKYPQFLLSTARTLRVKLFERLIKSLFFSVDFGQYTKSTLGEKLKNILKETKTEIVITTGGLFPILLSGQIKNHA